MTSTRRAIRNVRTSDKSVLIGSNYGSGEPANLRVAHEYGSGEPAELRSAKSDWRRGAAGSPDPYKFMANLPICYLSSHTSLSV